MSFSSPSALELPFFFQSKSKVRFQLVPYQDSRKGQGHKVEAVGGSFTGLDLWGRHTQHLERASSKTKIEKEECRSWSGPSSTLAVSPILGPPASAACR